MWGIWNVVGGIPVGTERVLGLMRGWVPGWETAVPGGWAVVMAIVVAVMSGVKEVCGVDFVG